MIPQIISSFEFFLTNVMTDNIMSDSQPGEKYKLNARLTV